MNARPMEDEEEVSRISVQTQTFERPAVGSLTLENILSSKTHRIELSSPLKLGIPSCSEYESPMLTFPQTPAPVPSRRGHSGPVLIGTPDGTEFCTEGLDTAALEYLEPNWEAPTKRDFGCPLGIGSG